MAGFDNNENKKRDISLNARNSSGIHPGARPGGVNPPQAPVPQSPAISSPGQPRPLQPGQPPQSPQASTQPPTPAPGPGTGRGQAPQTVRPMPQGTAAGSLASQSGMPQRPSSPQPGQLASGRPVVTQPVSPYAGATGAPPAAPGRPAAPQPVSPYAGAAVAPMSAQDRPVPPHPVSPYAGGALAGPGTAPGDTPPRQPPSPYAGAAVAAARITTDISDEEKKRLEEQERTQRYSELTFVEKVSFSGALVWGYRTNFIYGALAVVVFHWCLQHLIDSNFGSESDNILLGLPVLLLSSFASLFVGVCFATLISYIADHGDPESTTDLLFAPSSGGRFLKIAPSLALWALFYSIINYSIFTGSESSLISILANVVVISCTVPITMCIVYYIADSQDFTPMEGVIRPIKILTANIIDWLLLIPVSIFAIISAVIVIGALWTIPTLPVFGGLFVLGLQVLLSFSIIMMTASYIFVYGCYVFKETTAQLKLAGNDDDGDE